MANSPVFASEIQQMMYVAGETEMASLETVALIESIIKEQVIHLITTADNLASRRASRVFSNNDIIFQFRHDIARVERIQKLLALKALRKSSKGDEEDMAKADGEDADASQGSPAAVFENSKTVAAATRLPWDISSMFGELPPGPGEVIFPDEQNDKTLEKLRAADAKTLNMTVAEYATWSEYRHASFTKRRGARFRQWSGLGIIGDHMRTDDVLDIFGILTSEMVQRLTELALGIQDREMRRKVVVDEMAEAKTSKAYDLTQMGNTSQGGKGKGLRSKRGLRLI